VGKGLVYKQMSRHTAHHIQHHLVIDTLILQPPYQPIAGSLRGHADALVILANKVHS
jgi:hypothetical protein